MSEKRRGLGRGLGALIPSGTGAVTGRPDRPVDVFFADRGEGDVAEPVTPVTPDVPSPTEPTVDAGPPPTAEASAVGVDAISASSSQGATDLQHDVTARTEDVVASPFEAREQAPGYATPVPGFPIARDGERPTTPSYVPIRREDGTTSGAPRPGYGGAPSSAAVSAPMAPTVPTAPETSDDETGAVWATAYTPAPSQFTAPETASPEVAAPETAAADMAATDMAAPEGNATEATAPEAIFPGTTGTDATRTEATRTEGTGPEGTAPWETRREVAIPDVTAPEPTGPELVPVPGARFAELPVGSIRPNPKQPRTIFDEEALAELVHSIREIGVLQPIVVRPTTDDAEHPFELIMGERRWRATQEAGLDVIPAIIRDTEDDVLLRDALLENLHRSDLNALEEAAAYQQLLDDFGCTHEELATRIGRSRPQISNTIRLLRLPPAVQRRVASGVLSAGHARALLGLDDAEAMDKLASRIVAEGMSVRATEEAVSLTDAGPAAPPRKRPRAGGQHAELDDLARRLGDRLDTRVKIALGASKGRLSIEFASVEDLNRILEVLTPEERGAFKSAM